MSNILLYVKLMRLDRPIGIYLLLWPTLWALWLSAGGIPTLPHLLIFGLGVLLMRSAGCVINDIADRKFDPKVTRTQNRPLARGQLSVTQALLLFFVLLMLAFVLVLCLDRNTVELSVIAAAIAIIYPFCKRITHLPQVILGIAFAFSVLMVFMATCHILSLQAWLLFLAAAIWPLAYDTLYAMADKEDDLKIGVKSTAILFGEHIRLGVGVLQGIFLSIMLLIGLLAHLHMIYFIGLLLAGILIGYQCYLLRSGDKTTYFQAFLHNNHVGWVIFLGIFLSYALSK